MKQRRLLSVLVNDTPGVLQRVAGLFSRRSYNIESITVGTCEQEGLSRMIVAARGDDGQFQQISSQLNKLIDVLQVVQLQDRPVVSRELMLVKLKMEPSRRSEIQSLTETFRCSVIDVSPSTMVVQIVGDPEKNDAFLQLLQPYGIVEITRTGETAMNRG
ncbi:acetolactate synthase, small subunit [Paenibacillus sp. UNCCL117]|uniref:acetolactate synthase small subunit n=1 Tax=unclassified Paenibacillus TaxID=185978 RepID=UPI00087E407B|nr:MULTISPECIES: acetolactate synthase small subunit [unclassified Paenibacillus]SDC11891.1 acetolactate synthase, small subunit [Paenibacillus sp. cl123]SFW16704.1 acetolactate synthase, small subunit [Paenibacillus sp. UNCCL117]